MCSQILTSVVFSLPVLGAPESQNIGAPIVLSEGTVGGLGETPLELREVTKPEDLRETVASFLVNMQRGEDVELPKDAQENFGVTTWRELSKRFLDPEAFLLSAQIVELNVVSGREQVQARVIVTGIAEGIPFARYAMLDLATAGLVLDCKIIRH